MGKKKGVEKNKKSKIKKKEKINLKQEYAESWDYIKKSKNYFWIIAALIIITALIGFFIPAPEIISSEILKIINEIIEKTQNMGSLELISFIITNNIQTSFLGMIFGFILGIFPIITAAINGYLIGFVSAMSVGLEGGLSLIKLLPHGIFELPAIILALGLGIKLGDKFVEEIFRIKKSYLRITIIFLSIITTSLLAYLSYLKSLTLTGAIIFFVMIFAIIMIFSNKALKLESIKAIRVFVLIIFPLLLIAGIIEGSLILLLN
jgi:stage II sporulation protein M